MSKKIELLPEHIVNQIKAGEVVESPATLLKELIENSIDANSDKIEITISDDLTSLISVKDNGHGISKENLPLAFTRHATSKISSFSDIYQVYSFGFRGEALASIAAVSDLSCRSTYKNETCSAEIKNGQINELSCHQSSQGSGTEIYIKNLFYNTPARLKFIRSRNSEINKLKKIIDAFIISNPQITFIVTAGNREKQFYPSVTVDSPIKKRIIQLINTNKKKVSVDDIFHRVFEYKSHKIQFFANTKGSKGPSGKRQYLIANKRYFHDKKLHHLIMRKMSDTFWGTGNFGDYVCIIDLPADLMDPNVHPSKTEIKFVHHEYIYSALSTIIKNDQAHLDIKNNNHNLNIKSNYPDLNLKTSQDHHGSTQTKNELNKPDTEFNIRDTYFLKLENEKETNELMRIFDHYYIFKNEKEEVNLINAKNTFVNFLHFFYSNHKSLLNEHSTLLIGITFSKSDLNDRGLEKFSHLNIILERISDELFILKDVPEILSFLSSKIIKPILLGLINPRLYNPEDIFKKFTNEIDLRSLLNIEKTLPEKNRSKKLTRDFLDNFLQNE